MADDWSPVPSLLMPLSVAMMKSEVEYASYWGLERANQLPDELSSDDGLFGVSNKPVKGSNESVDIEFTILPIAHESK